MNLLNKVNHAVNLLTRAALCGAESDEPLLCGQRSEKSAVEQRLLQAVGRNVGVQREFFQERAVESLREKSGFNQPVVQIVCRSIGKVGLLPQSFLPISDRYIVT